jgi:phosphoribosylformimino-5-aminoimidazole carboxamide ribotide isomerase
VRLLPVLDLLNGQIVRGVGGRRHEYRPIVSRWTDSAEPSTVARALHDAFGFAEFYLADLDAIAGRAPALECYERLRREGFELLVDAGVRTAADGRGLLAAGLTVVIGLETVQGPGVVAELLAVAGPERLVFSLDLKNGVPMGDLHRWSGCGAVELAAEAVTLGVRRLLVLDLARVGSGGGVGSEDLCLRLKQTHPQIELLAGGGIGGIEDLVRLAACGVGRALVASALHDGRLDPMRIRESIPQDDSPTPPLPRGGSNYSLPHLRNPP